MRLAVLSALLALGSAPAGAQTVNSYTQNVSGPQSFALGYPVPIPVESLTPVDGFRSYESLHARLQALALETEDVAGQVVGGTIKGREIFAYTVSDPDEETVDGLPEPVFLINGGIHAREWQSPEVVTGIIERFVDRRGDAGLYDYLMENTRLVAIPVLNVDGFLQTQRYPTRVIVGQDPSDSSWPRDGRMRRKNMRGVDEDLFTFGDHLRGVDLNRNNPPNAPSPSIGASSNPNNLTFHGNGALTEPETQALADAAELAGAGRLRLFVDFHSFGAIFFDFLTGNTRRNLIQARLISRATRHLFEAGTPHTRQTSGSIGSTDEFFSEVFEVPAWTHEIEPDMPRGGRQYGGFGVTHDGFILPDREIARVRRELADTYALLFYTQAGPPSVTRATVLDSGGGTVYDAEWRRTGPNRRVLDVIVDEPLLAGGRYTVRMVFDKPMRMRDESGTVVNYPGMNAPLVPRIRIEGDGFEIEADADPAGWFDQAPRDGQAGYHRYADDTYQTVIRVPADAAEPGVSRVTMSVAAQDLAEQALDADPSTVVGWSGGHWTNYEGSDGTAGDLGGTDRTVEVRLEAAEPDRLRFEPASYEALEGSIVPVTVVREGDGAGAVEARVEVSLFDVDLLEDWSIHDLQWGDGQTGARTVLVPTAEDFRADEQAGFDNSLHPMSMEVLSGPAEVEEQEAAITVTHDNDTGSAGIASIAGAEPYLSGFDGQGDPVERNEAQARGAALCDFMKLARAAQQSRPGRRITINLADGAEHVLDSTNCAGQSHSAFEPVIGDLRIIGRDSIVRLGQSAPDGQRLFEIAAGGELTLQGLILEGGRPDSPLAGGAILNDGRLFARDVIFRGNTANRAGALNNRGEATLVNVRFVDNQAEQGAGAVYNTGALTLTGATFSGNTTPGRGGAVLNQGALAVRDSTFADNEGVPGSDIATSGEAVVGNSILASNGSCVEEAGGSIASEGYNLNPDLSCALQGTGDIADPDAMLMVLDSDALRVPSPDSPAVDAGDPEGCGAADAAGVARPFTLGMPIMFPSPPVCEIGAAEFGFSVHRGMWWNPERAGHGIDLQQAGNQLIATWFTYEPDGDPVWYQAVAPFGASLWEAELFRYRFDHDEMQATAEAVGSIALSFQSRDRATFSWDLTPIGQGEGQQPFEPFLAVPGAPVVDLTAHWAAADLSDWGLTVDTQGDVTIATLYYYDAQGNPRWVQGVGPAALQSPMAVESFTGFCPGCDPMAQPFTGAPAGSLELRFLTRDRALIDTELTYPGAEGGDWQRVDAPLGPLSDPVP